MDSPPKVAGAKGGVEDVALIEFSPFSPDWSRHSGDAELR